MAYSLKHLKRTEGLQWTQEHSRYGSVKKWYCIILNTFISICSNVFILLTTTVEIQSSPSSSLQNLFKLHFCKLKKTLLLLLIVKYVCTKGLRIQKASKCYWDIRSGGDWSLHEDRFNRNQMQAESLGWIGKRAGGKEEKTRGKETLYLETSYWEKDWAFKGTVHRNIVIINYEPDMNTFIGFLWNTSKATKRINCRKWSKCM